MYKLIQKQDRADIDVKMVFCDARIFHNQISNNWRWLVQIQLYTARQFCGIILLVWLYCLTAGRNLCQSQYKASAWN